MPRINATLTIANRLGLHARAASKFVKLAASFDADILVAKDGQEVSGVSILGLMMLAAGPGETIDIHADGPEAEAAVQALSGLVADRFNEA